MGGNIKECVKMLEECLEEDFDFGTIKTAIYLYIEFGRRKVEELSEQDIEKLFDFMEFEFEDSLFNEKLNTFVKKNLEVE